MINLKVTFLTMLLFYSVTIVLFIAIKVKLENLNKNRIKMSFKTKYVRWTERFLRLNSSYIVHI